MLTGPSVQIGGNDIKPYLVGGSAYPLASWLQKPFPEARDPEEIAFNKALSGARVAVWCAFGMLKKRLDSKISFANKIAVACAVVHNFCLLNHDDWDDNENDDPRDQGRESNNDDVIRDGYNVRSVLREYIANA